MNKPRALRQIAQGEGQYVEFKESRATLDPAIKTLAAFASQKGGGCVFIGVNDDGEFNKGLQIGHTTVEKVSQDIKANTQSMVSATPLLPLIHVFNEPTLIVIEVPRAAYKDGPYTAFGHRWKRSGKSTHRVDMDSRQLAHTYQKNLWDEKSPDPLAFRFCARCGSTKLTQSQATDHAHDRSCHFIKCDDCDWQDWSE